MKPADPWAQLLGVQTPAQPGDGPLGSLLRIERASTSDFKPFPEDYQYFRDALARTLAGERAEIAFGFTARQGKRNETPLRRLVHHRRLQAAVLLIPAAAENANQATEAVCRVARGEVPPPSPEAADALEELRRCRERFPTSPTVVRSLVIKIFEK